MTRGLLATPWWCWSRPLHMARLSAVAARTVALGPNVSLPPPRWSYVVAAPQEPAQNRPGFRAGALYPDALLRDSGGTPIGLLRVLIGLEVQPLSCRLLAAPLLAGGPAQRKKRGSEGAISGSCGTGPPLYEVESAPCRNSKRQLVTNSYLPSACNAPRTSLVMIPWTPALARWRISLGSSTVHGITHRPLRSAERTAPTASDSTISRLGLIA